MSETKKVKTSVLIVLPIIIAVVVINLMEILLGNFEVLGYAGLLIILLVAFAYLGGGKN